jgi:hypothetical protein
MRRKGSASEPGPKFWEAERHVIEDRVLPGFDEKFARFSETDRARVKRMIRDKLAVIATLTARHMDTHGERTQARSKYLQAIRLAPLSPGIWYRFARHLARVA